MATAAAGQQDRKIVVIVAVAVLNTASVNEQRVIEERRVTFAYGLHFAKQIGELLNMKVIDATDLALFFLIASMVRQ